MNIIETEGITYELDEYHYNFSNHHWRRKNNVLSADNPNQRVVKLQCDDVSKLIIRDCIVDGRIHEQPEPQFKGEYGQAANLQIKSNSPYGVSSVYIDNFTSLGPAGDGIGFVADKDNGGSFGEIRINGFSEFFRPTGENYNRTSVQIGAPFDFLHITGLRGDIEIELEAAHYNPDYKYQVFIDNSLIESLDLNFENEGAEHNVFINNCRVTKGVNLKYCNVIASNFIIDTDVPIQPDHGDYKLVNGIIRGQDGVGMQTINPKGPYNWTSIGVNYEAHSPETLQHFFCENKQEPGQWTRFIHDHFKGNIKSVAHRSGQFSSIGCMHDYQSEEAAWNAVKRTKDIPNRFIYAINHVPDSEWMDVRGGNYPIDIIDLTKPGE